MAIAALISAIMLAELLLPDMPPTGNRPSIPQTLSGAGNESPASERRIAAALADTATVAARPIFATDRRPAVMATAVQTVSVPRLIGIITAGRQRQAIFEAPFNVISSGHSVAMHEGDSVALWVIKSINPSAVLIADAAGDKWLVPQSGATATHAVDPVTVPKIAESGELPVKHHHDEG